ncbi:MAG: disulfide bond formation protein B [Tatlockia sp.]|nr:disulfide bond formation protein B [Tatlockia sp.]
MTKIAYQRWQLLLTFFSFIVLAASFYFQYVKGLQPCPLCLMQRFCVLLLFGICFSGTAIRSLKAGKIIAGLQFLVAAGGLYFASRQLWLQSLPAGQSPSCLPELEVLIRYFPLQDVLHALFWGTKECGEVSWRWLGLSMPAWVALYFLIMLLSAIPIFWVLRKQAQQLSYR